MGWTPETERHANIEDRSRPMTEAIVLTAGVALLAAVGLVLLLAGQSHGGTKAYLITIGVISVGLSWAVVHTVFMLRYTRSHYQANRWRRRLVAPHSGFIASIESEQIGVVSMHLGAGRFKKGDEIDHRTGLLLHAKVGEYRSAGEPLVEVHARSSEEAAAVYPCFAGMLYMER